MSNSSVSRALTCVAAAVACLLTGTSSALDVSKPDEAYQAMLRIIGDLDGKPVFKDWDVTIFAALPGAKPKPILRMQGYNAGRLINKPEGSYEWVTREVAYYQDLKTGEIIER